MIGRNGEDWAVFWCSLLSPLLVGEIPADQRGRYFRELSEEERLLPNGRRKRISVRTLRRQWSRLREQGVPGLFRRRRKDRGQARKAQADLLARAVELKKEQPYRSDQVINPILKREFGRVVPRSTLYLVADQLRQIVRSTLGPTGWHLQLERPRNGSPRRLSRAPRPDQRKTLA